MFDCGPIEPNDKEVARGWQGINGTLIIPQLKNVHDIPRTGLGDQIYILNHPTVEPIAGEFMNSDAFTLESIEDILATIKSDGEQIQQGTQFDDLLTPMQDEFWSSIEKSSARAFLGDGVSQFIFVTDEETVHSEVLRWLLTAAP